MKKIIDSFYIFSKFSLSLILLICLIGTLYILYTNYNKQDELSQNKLSLEQELQRSINKNSELIKNISLEITSMLFLRSIMISFNFDKS